MKVFLKKLISKSLSEKTKRRLKKIYRFKKSGVLLQQVLRYFWAIPFVQRYIKFWAERFWPIDDRKIVFATFSHQFNCNPGAIAQTLVARNSQCQLVFLVLKKNIPELQKSEIGQKVKFVNVWSWRGLREAATAKILLENAQVFLWPSFLKKRPGQIYVNTWHGSLGIKRIDTAFVLKNRAKLSKEYTDCCISNSDFEDMVLETSFFEGVPKIHLGHARNDIFFQSEENMSVIRNKCRQYFGLSDSCKIALYAPTFRDKGLYKGFFKIDYDALTDEITRKFGGEWKVLVKLHPHDAKRMQEAKLSFPASVINANSYANINELLQITDIGITDYSSWIFDYINTRRPGFIYAPDIDAYKRGFYYPLTDAPFPVTHSGQQLCEAILNFDLQKYQTDVEAFLDKMGSVDDGKSSDRVADFLEDLIAGKNVISN